MSNIESAVTNWTANVESKLSEFSKRQRAQAELINEVKAVLERGRQTESKADRDHRVEFAAYVADPNDSQQHKRLIEAQAEAKVINSTVDADGALAVPRTLQTAADVVAATLNPWQDLAQPVGPDWRYTYAYGMTVGRSAESGTRSATLTPTFKSVTPPHSEFYAHASLYNFALEDVQDVEALLATEWGRQLGAQLATDIVSGSGSSGQIRGLLAVTPEAKADYASPERAEFALEYVAVGSSPLAITLDNISDLLDEFSEEYLLDPSFAIVMRPATWHALIMNQSGTDAPFNMPRNPTLFGYPVKLTTAVAAVAGDAFPVIAGAFRRGYVLGQRGPMRVMADPFSTKGSTVWMATVRYAGSPLGMNNAVKAVKYSAS